MIEIIKDWWQKTKYDYKVYREREKQLDILINDCQTIEYAKSDGNVYSLDIYGVETKLDREPSLFDDVKD